MKPPAVPGSAPATSQRPVFFRVFPSIMLPMFLAVVDQTIVATALPAIAASMGDVERASWVVVSYLVATTIAAPVYGNLGDVFGRRRLMFVALPIFIVASLMCASARNIWMLTACRVLQGFGGGGLMTLSQALIGEAIPPRERARYQGYLAAVAVSSNAFGPVAGGYLTQHFGWQSIFLINVPVGLLAIWLTFRLEPLPRSAEPWRFDAPGLLLFALFVAPMLLALEQAQRLDPKALPGIVGLVVLSIFAAGLLLRRERRASSPLLPLTLLRQPSIWRSDVLAACHGAALVSLITFLPIYLMVVRGLSASQTGLMLVPLTIGIGVGSLITGQLVARTGRTMIFPSFGLILVTLNMLILAFWAQDLSMRQLAWLLLVDGLFTGTVMGVVQVTVQKVSGPQLLGEGAASVQFSRSVGAAFGTAAVGAVLFAVLAATDPDAAHLFVTIVEHGPTALSSRPATGQGVLQGEIADAFRAAFLAIAAFAGLGVIVALSIPERLIS
ncbi:MAG TPA: MDR family MFS transporter [Xanthobacteraceae bacterium]|nr:MDR family MFS transporter [Xanthobacteraceae bacterium]